MENASKEPSAEPRSSGFDWLHVLLFVLLALLVVGGATVWLLKTQIFPSEFKPVTLSTGETAVLNAKLDALEAVQESDSAVHVRGRKRVPAPDASESPPTALPLAPEPYSEVGRAG